MSRGVSNHPRPGLREHFTVLSRRQVARRQDERANPRCLNRLDLGATIANSMILG
jgi:hypothetical protein